MRSLRRSIVALAAAILVLWGQGCGGDGDSEPPTASETAARELADLAAISSDRGAEAIPAGELPPGPLGGLRVDLPGAAVGYVYRYRSASAVKGKASSFLGFSDGGLITGCGSFLFFTDPQGARSRGEEEWRESVRRGVRLVEPEIGEDCLIVIV